MQKLAAGNNSMRRCFIGILSLFLTQSVFAAQDIFTIPAQDLSIKLLNRIFGSVGTVLTGPVATTPVMNVLKYFNNACLVLGGILILYSLIVSTVNTAHDGEMLGKKWNSIWIPVRAALGFGLLLPTKATFVVIQVFVLWVIIQGVGAADYLWENTISQPQNYQPPELSSMYLETVMNHSNLIYLDEVCQTVGAALLSTPTMTVTPKTTDTGNSFQFGFSSLSNKPDICGSVDYNTDGSSPTKGETADLINNIQNSATDPFVRSYFPDYPNYNETQPIDTAQQAKIIDGIKNASYAFMNAQIAANQPSSSDTLSEKVVQDAIKNGWIAAGGYYIAMSNWSQANSGGEVEPPDVAPPSSSIAGVIPQSNAPVLDAVMKSALNSTCFAGSDQAICSLTPQGDPNAGIKFNSPKYKHTLVSFVISPILTVLKNVVIYGFNIVIKNTGVGVFGSLSSAANPIITLSAWGKAMLTTLSDVFFLMLTIIAVVGGFTYICSCASPLGYTFGSLLTWVVPFMLVIVGFVWMFGTITAYYVPLVPYLLFTLGSVAWLIAVIEAMVAAPLLALGILHPEGRHDVFGHASAGIMILASVFLRPSLMIVGFWASYIMVGVVISLLNGGFAYVAQSISGEHGLSLWGVLSFIAIYTIVLLIVINKAFSLIYVLPDKILRWIGGPQEQTDVGRELEQVKSGYEQQAQKMQQQGAGKALQGQTQLAQDTGRDEEKPPGGTGGGAV